jgi:hypothetical protein
MREMPILFSTEMVAAIIGGHKTMTRRVCKGARELSCVLDWPIDTCPYGKIGSHLWVRETWRPDNTFAGGGIPRLGIKFGHGYEWKALNPNQTGKWKPSIFMPREASRITLEITNIRVERLQEITPEDAVAEGAEYMPPADLRKERLSVSQIIFAGLWDKLNAKRVYSWDSNPWVWCISFKRI